MLKLQSRYFSDKEIFFYFGALVCALLSVFFNFFDEKSSRISFFFSSYFAIAGLVFFRPSLKKWNVFFVLALVLLGSSKLFWFAIEYIGNPDFDIYNSYLATGKRLILAALIAWFLLAYKERYRVRTAQLIKGSLIVAFVVASGVGLYQYFTGLQRVDFYQGRATDAAYMYSALAAAVIFMLAKSSRLISLIQAGAVFLLALYLVFLTGTRNVMLAFPAIVMVIGLLKFRHLGWKMLMAIVLAVGIVTGASYNSVIKPKVSATEIQLALYERTNGNVVSSLSSRLAMWKVGAASFEQHPLGMSQEDRIVWFKQYVAEHHREKASLAFVNIHLHNEVIETASLQGIQGLVVLLLFYATMLLYARKSHNPLLLATVLVVIFSGLTDVIFISREQSIFFPLIFILSALWHNEKPRNETPALK